jgi:hypothetical protein
MFMEYIEGCLVKSIHTQPCVAASVAAASLDLLSTNLWSIR